MPSTNTAPLLPLYNYGFYATVYKQGDFVQPGDFIHSQRERRRFGRMVRKVTRKSYDELWSEWASMLNQGLVSQVIQKRENHIKREIELCSESEVDPQLKCSCFIDDLTLWKSIRNCTYGEITFDFVHPVDDVTENLWTV